MSGVGTLPQRERSYLRGRAQEGHQTLGVKAGFTQRPVSCFLGKIWICQKKKSALVIHLTLMVTSNCTLMVSYPRRHRQTREDAASTSHTSPLLLSGCLGRRCPRCIERTPERKSLNTLLPHLAASLQDTVVEKTKHLPAWCLHFQSS